MVLLVSLSLVVAIVPVNTSTLRISTGTTIILGNSANRIVFTGGRNAELSVTDAAGVVAKLLLYRCKGLSHRVAMASRVIQIRNSSVKLLPNSGIALRSLLCNLVLTSNGSTTGAVTVIINGDVDNFTGVVGSGTGRVKLGGADFIAPSNLSSRGRCAATCSVTILARCTLGGASFTTTIKDRSTALGCNGPPCQHALAGRGGLLGVISNYVNIGANCAGGSNEYLISTMGHSNGCIVTMALDTPSS